MRICIISNSHGAMLKQAIGALPINDIKIDIYAAPATRMSNMRLSRVGDKLITSDSKTKEYISLTSGGKSEIVLENYDHFVLVGLTAKIQYGLMLYRDHQVFGHSSENPPAFISDRSYTEAVDEHFQRSSAVHLLKIFSDLNIRTMLVTSPYPSETLINRNGYDYLQDNNAAMIMDFIRVKYEGILHSACIKYGSELVLPPKLSLGSLGLTRSNFSDGAPKLSDDGIFDDNDDHMNADYGKLVVEQIFGILNGPLLTQS